MAVYLAKNIKIWKVSKLKTFENNSRTHGDGQISKLKASIKEFGFLVPILVYEKDEKIIAGEGRLIAAKELGLKEVSVIVLDHLTESQRRAYIIADNKIAQESGWDMDVLEEELETLMNDGFDLSLTGFSEDEIKELERFVDEDETVPFAESELEDPGEVDTEDDDLTIEDDAPEKEPDELTKEDSTNVKLKPISKNGDLWILDEHQVVCGITNESECDAIIIGWQKLTRKKAKLKGTRFTFDEMRSRRDSKLSKTIRRTNKK